MPEPAAHQVDPLALLERAVGYTRGSLGAVAPSSVGLATPCCGWDVATLIAHLDDSLAALQEGAGQGVSLLPAPVPRIPATDPAAPARARATALLGAWVARGSAPTAVADRAVTRDLVLLAGAVEIAVHGWDLARGCGASRPLPDPLARDLLPVAHRLLAAHRPDCLGAPLLVPPLAPAGTRLLGFVGRRAW